MKRAGFTPRGMVATVAGTLATRGEHRLLRWGEPEYELRLRGKALAAAPLDDGRRVRATGTMTVDRAEAGGALTLEMRVDELDVVGN